MRVLLGIFRGRGHRRSRVHRKKFSQTKNQ
jgi:hypothetical protein